MGRRNAPYKEILVEEAIAQWLERAAKSPDRVVKSLLKRQEGVICINPFLQVNLDMKSGKMKLVKFGSDNGSFRNQTLGSDIRADLELFNSGRGNRP